MYSINELKKDVMISLNGTPYRVIDSQHVSLGRGGAVMRTKLKNLLNGSMVDRTFRAAEKVPAADVTRANMEYLYSDDTGMIFMNQDTYEQEAVGRDTLGEAAKYVPEGSKVIMMLFNGRPIGADIPNAVQLKVTHTEPGVKGDTATSAMKPATVETGAEIMVPLFINEGDTIKVDTRDGRYIERQK